LQQASALELSIDVLEEPQIRADQPVALEASGDDRRQMGRVKREEFLRNDKSRRRRMSRPYVGAAPELPPEGFGHPVGGWREIIHDQDARQFDSLIQLRPGHCALQEGEAYSTAIAHEMAKAPSRGSGANRAGASAHLASVS
jgi:hypothetical protein